MLMLMTTYECNFFIIEIIHIQFDFTCQKNLCMENFLEYIANARYSWFSTKGAPLGWIEDGGPKHTHPHTQRNKTKNKTYVKAGKWEGSWATLKSTSGHLRSQIKSIRSSSLWMMDVGPQGHLKCTGSLGFQAKAIVVSDIYIKVYVYKLQYICGYQYRHHFCLAHNPCPKRRGGQPWLALFIVLSLPPESNE